jgi:hypothetical protein
MRLETVLLFILPLFASCQSTPNHDIPAKMQQNKEENNSNPYTNIGNIPLPAGYKRVPVGKDSFADWLRGMPLKKDKTVYLYNGKIKANQTAQFAVLDISTGTKDLQQCADAVIRCRAEWLYSRKWFDEIDFTDNEQTHYRFTNGPNRASFDHYLESVFAACGTLSLSKQLRTLTHPLQAGDVLIKGGSPGHAMLVMDCAVNTKGKKIFLLAQSYMPAQDMHVVKNPGNKILSPWYELHENTALETPEWVFRNNAFMEWIGKY